MDARNVHNQVQRIYKALGKLMQEFESEFAAEEDRARIETEYNRISAERNALDNAQVADRVDNANPRHETAVPVVDGVKTRKNVDAENK